MKLISWNVNGLRACVKKGFLDHLTELDPDVICLQETKLQPDQIQLDLPHYTLFWNSADKKGYSGTAIFTKEQPLRVENHFGEEIHRHEGRTITAEYPKFFLVCCYTPNAQDLLKRIEYRMQWETDLRAYLKQLDERKPVILCGDLNVAHQPIDLKNPDKNHKNPGFTDEERGKFSELLAAGFTDTYRKKYPNQRDAYSWWSYRSAARERNVGWRIDYFLISDRLYPAVRDAMIFPEIEGSDHCPVGLEIETN
ncbi:MAG: exodeoxyribonuclease III [Evtepia sp.]